MFQNRGKHKEENVLDKTSRYILAYFYPFLQASWSVGFYLCVCVVDKTDYIDYTVFITFFL